MSLHPESWVSNYGDYLYSIALLKLSQKEVAEDLVQETFMSALQASNNFRGESSEKTWLVRILNNKIIDFYRKKDVLKEVATDLNVSENSFYSHFFAPTRTSDNHWKGESQPREWPDENQRDQSEFEQILQACLKKLPPKMHPVFVMKFLDELESDEICKELEITASNYWVLIHRAKLVMRECLEKNWYNA